MQHPMESLFFEYRMIGDIAKKYPQSSEILERYFGQDCLKKLGFEVQTLEMACILFGVDQKKLLKALEDLRK